MVDGKGQPGVSSGDQTQWLGQEPCHLDVPGKGVHAVWPPEDVCPETHAAGPLPILSPPVLQPSRLRLQEMGGAVPGAGVVRVPAISQPSFLPGCLLSTCWGPGTPQRVATVGSGPPLRGVLWGQHSPKNPKSMVSAAQEEGEVVCSLHKHLDVTHPPGAGSVQVAGGLMSESRRQRRRNTEAILSHVRGIKTGSDASPSPHGAQTGMGRRTTALGTVHRVEGTAEAGALRPEHAPLPLG